MILIPRTIWAEMMYLVRKTSNEVSGVGLVRQEGEDLLVEKIFFPKQVGSTGNTTLDAMGLAKIADSLNDNELSKLRLWWHSHGKGTVFWSDTDHKTASKIIPNEDWFLSIVFNHKGEYKARVDVVKPVRMYGDVSIEVLDNIDTEMLDKLFEDNFSEYIASCFKKNGKTMYQSCEDWDDCEDWRNDYGYPSNGVQQTNFVTTDQIPKKDMKKIQKIQDLFAAGKIDNVEYQRRMSKFEEKYGEIVWYV